MAKEMKDTPQEKPDCKVVDFDKYIKEKKEEKLLKQILNRGNPLAKNDKE